MQNSDTELEWVECHVMCIVIPWEDVSGREACITHFSYVNKCPSSNRKPWDITPKETLYMITKKWTN